MTSPRQRSQEAPRRAAATRGRPQSDVAVWTLRRTSLWGLRGLEATPHVTAAAAVALVILLTIVMVIWIFLG